MTVLGNRKKARRGPIGNMNHLKRLEEEVSAWPQISVHAHRFGGREFRFGSAEVGQVHQGGMVDIPFPRSVRDALPSLSMQGRCHADSPSDLRSDRSKFRRATSGEAPNRRAARNCLLNPTFEHAASKIGVGEANHEDHRTVAG